MWLTKAETLHNLRHIGLSTAGAGEAVRRERPLAAQAQGAAAAAGCVWQSLCSTFLH